jgi:hypothetical protein
MIQSQKTRKSQGRPQHTPTPQVRSGVEIVRDALARYDNNQYVEKMNNAFLSRRRSRLKP